MKYLSLLFSLFLCFPLIADVKNNKNPKTEKVKKIVFLGDSITAGYGVSKTAAYPNQIQILLDKKGYKTNMINAGISGSTTASAIGRLKSILKSKPNIIVLALGGNDGLRGLDLSASKKNLAQAIKLCLDNNVKVVLAGMKIPINYGKKYRQQFEAIYKDLAKKYKVIFIPFLIEAVGGVAKYNLADGIHPNEAGHKQIAKHVAPFLEPLL